MVSELPTSPDKHKVRAEGRQSRAIWCRVGLGLTAPAGVDWLVLEEKKDIVVVGRGGFSVLL